MASSMLSPRIITILSLVALCTLSLTVVFGSHNIFDTLTRDTLAHDSPFSFPKISIVHHRRALHHARATTPLPASESNPPQSNPAPSQPAPSTPAANTQASSAAPVSSAPAPSSSQQSQTQDNASSAPSSRAISTSAASTSASPSLSSTLAPSSSSLSAQSSSSPSVTSSFVGTTSNTAKNPTTTIADNPVTHTSGRYPTNPAGSTIYGATATPGVGATSGFFKNKAAVGATFSIIGIVGGLVVIMAILTVMKRRRRSRYARDDEGFFEKYPTVDLNDPAPHIPPGFGSDAPSFTDLDMSAAPIDAYPDRAVHYGQSNAGAILNPVDYGIAYPPGAANNNNSTPVNRNGHTHEDTESEYSVPSGSHPFADPANTSGATSAPPVSYPRPFAGRVQEMVTTDSYYGPNSAGVGAGGVGFAQ